MTQRLKMNLFISFPKKRIKYNNLNNDINFGNIIIQIYIICHLIQVHQRFKKKSKFFQNKIRQRMNQTLCNMQYLSSSNEDKYDKLYQNI